MSNEQSVNTQRALIGGTGFLDVSTLTVINDIQVKTPFGEPSSPIYHVRIQDQLWYLLLRHGQPHHIPPHCINYRANVWALKSLGVSDVIAVNAVGGIHERAAEGCLVLPDQLIDYTHSRDGTFYGHGLSGELKADIERVLPTPLEHIEFSDPFSSTLRQRIIAAAIEQDVALEQQGVCAVTQGPRLETAAEIQRLARDGCDIVGMTSLPEASLARELSMNYASLAMVVNKAAGLSESEITLDEIHQVAQGCMVSVLKVLEKLTWAG